MSAFFCLSILSIKACTHTHIHDHIHAHSHVYTHTHSHTLTHSYTHVRTHNSYRFTCTHAHAHCLVQFSSGAQSCPTLCDPMTCSTPVLPVHHQPPEFTQTHVHRVGDAIQPSHPLSSSSPPAPNPSQHQSLFQ